MLIEIIFGEERIEKGRVFLLALFSFCIPLNQKWSTLLLLVLVALCLFMAKKRELYSNLDFLLPPALYLLIALSLFYSEKVELRYLEQRASLIAFPIIFSISRLTSKERIRVFEYFVWGCALAIIICYVNAVNNSMLITNGDFSFKPVVNEEFSFMYSVVRDGNYFFSSHFSLFHQTSYFALFLNTAIAIILAFSLWRKNSIFLFYLFFYPLVIFQLSSKINLLLCGLVFMIYGLYRINKMIYKLMFIVSIFSIGILFILKNPRGKIMVETLVERGFTIEPSERYGYSLRLMSWDAALAVASKNPILGVGVGDTQSELNLTYEKKGYLQPLKEELNAHNQYLQTTLVGGLLGLLILLGMHLSLLAKARFSIFANDRLFITMFLIIITLTLFFESVLNRYSGISFFFLFYYLIITQEHKKLNSSDN